MNISAGKKAQETKLVCGVGVLTKVVRQMPASLGRTQHSVSACGQGARLATESSLVWVTLSGKSKMRVLVGFVLALRGMHLAL